MTTARWAILFSLLSLAFVATGSAPIRATAATQTASTETAEMVVSLYVLDPHWAGKKGIEVAWLPQPLQKYCVGKTGEQCANIDYCIRTTNKQAKTCQNLGVDTQHITFPADMRPKRMLSVELVPAKDPKLDNFPALTKYFDGAPPGSFDHLSQSHQITANVRFTRTASDDGFNLLQVISVPAS